MAVLDIVESVESGGRQNQYTGDFREIDFKEEARWTKVFRITLTGPTQDLESVLRDCQTLGGGTLFQAQFGAPSNYRFPQTGDPHPINASYGAKEFNLRHPQPQDAPQLVDCEVVYVLYYNPLQEPAQVDLDYITWDKVIEAAFAPSPLPIPIFNADGTIPITNSAYSPFDPPPTKLQYDRLLRVKVNLLMSTWDDQNVMTNFVQVTNSAPFVVTYPDGHANTYAVNTVLLEAPPKATTHFRSTVAGGIHYMETNWEFKIRNIGWFYRIADMGYSTFDFVTLTNIPIYIGGAIAQNPQKLDTQGQQAALNAAPNYLNFHVFSSVDLNALNLFPPVPA